MLISPLLIVVIVVGFYLISSIKILNEYERAVIFRLGKLLPQPKGPGVALVFAPIDRMAPPSRSPLTQPRARRSGRRTAPPAPAEASRSA